MTFKKILRVIAIVGIPFLFLLQLISFLFIVQHWEGGRALSMLSAPLLLITMVEGFLYALLVKPQPKFHKPTFDYGAPVNPTTENQR